jgi:drug/metabolite transporter (DMT)-like permease
MTKRGLALFAAMAFIWGIPYLLIRIAVRELDPGVLVFGRTVPAAIIMLTLVAYKKQFPIMIANIKWILIFAVIEFGIPWYLMGTSEKHLTSSITSLLICCVPLFSVLGQLIRRTEHEKISQRRMFGLAIGIIGVAFLVGIDVRGGSIGWVALLLIVCVGYTIGPIILATKLNGVPGSIVIAGSSAFVAVCWTPWTLTHWPAHISGETWACVGTLSIVCTAIAFVVFGALIAEIGATRSTVITYINTAVAVVLGVVFLNEPLTAGILVGFPLVLMGSIYATSSKAATAVETHS